MSPSSMSTNKWTESLPFVITTVPTLIDSCHSCRSPMRSVPHRGRSCEKKTAGRRLTPITRIRRNKRLRNYECYYSFLICVIGANLRQLFSFTASVAGGSYWHFLNHQSLASHLLDRSLHSRGSSGGPMRSVPHRGSGWVLLALSQSSKSGKSSP